MIEDTDKIGALLQTSKEPFLPRDEQTVEKLRNKLRGVVYDSWRDTENADSLISTCLEGWQKLDNRINVKELREELIAALDNANAVLADNQRLVDVVEGIGLDQSEFLKLNIGNSLMYLIERFIGSEVGLRDFINIEEIRSIGGKQVKVTEDVAHFLRENSIQLSELESTNDVPVFADSEYSKKVGEKVLDILKASSALPQKGGAEAIIFLSTSQEQIGGLGRAHFNDYSRTLIVGTGREGLTKNEIVLLTVAFNFSHEHKHSEQLGTLPGVTAELEAILEEKEALSAIELAAKEGGKLSNVVEDGDKFASAAAFQRKFMAGGKAKPILEGLRGESLERRLTVDHNIAVLQARITDYLQRQQ